MRLSWYRAISPMTHFMDRDATTLSRWFGCNITVVRVCKYQALVLIKPFSARALTPDLWMKTPLSFNLEREQFLRGMQAYFGGATEPA